MVLYKNLTTGYYLAHSSGNVEITNIISVISQQAPEYHVSKITDRSKVSVQAGNKIITY
jgi:hypothetical protein